MNDFDFQLEFVKSNAWRLMALQDMDPASPTYGCLDYKFWRDKTAEFPDARYQEAAATLLLLDAGMDSSQALSESRHYACFSAGLAFLAGQQYPDGSFDEWYKGERGFAATEFTTIAFGLCAVLGRLAQQEKTLLERMIFRACEWLETRHDRVKANHEAAAAAALAIGWKVTGDDRFKRAAKAKITDLLERQTAEGWFPEIGGMDLGYCSVLLDYVMLYTKLSGDEVAIPAMNKLIDFMANLMHPDLTISPEFGLCLNPYVSRLGIGLLSPYNYQAAQLVSLLKQCSPGVRGLLPTLADDLRFCRWSHLPVVSGLLGENFRQEESAVMPMGQHNGGWRVFEKSAAVVYHQGDFHVYFAVSGGGGVRAYSSTNLILEYLGPIVEYEGVTLASRGYDTRRPVRINGNEAESTFGLAPGSAFSPSFISRLLLRIACMTPLGSKLARSAIDAYRIRRGTAINQSSAPLANGKPPISVTRAIRVEDGKLVVRDILIGDRGDIDTALVNVKAVSGAVLAPVEKTPGVAAMVSITLSIDMRDAVQKLLVSIFPEKRG